jgi:hypothetical protein
VESTTFGGSPWPEDHIEQADRGADCRQDPLRRSRFQQRAILWAHDRAVTA